MAEEQLLERLTREIRQRLEEIRPLVEEQRALERALDALQGISGDDRAQPPQRAQAPASAAPPAPRRAASRGGRAGRGQRREELLQLVKGSPISISEAARQMGIAPSQASTLARKLTEEGLLARHDGRLVLVAEAASQAPPESAGDPASAAEDQAPAPPPVVPVPSRGEAPAPPPVVPVPPGPAAPPPTEPPFPDWSDAGSTDPVRRSEPASPPRPIPPEHRDE